MSEMLNYAEPIFINESVVLMPRELYDHMSRRHDDAQLRSAIERTERRIENGKAVFHNAKDSFARIEEKNGIKV